MTEHGGSRHGTGRKAGGKNKLAVERALRAQHGLNLAIESGLLPLDVILARMRDEPLPNGQKSTIERFEAAVAAAQYLHPRYSMIAASVTTVNPAAQKRAEEARRILMADLNELAAHGPVVADNVHQTTFDE